MSRLAGTGTLLRATIRQDARNIAPWVVLISLLSASSILAHTLVFTDAQDRAELAVAVGTNPALSLIFGPAPDLTTADGFNAWRSGALGALFAGLMALLIVVRNSRADEDSGRAELIASGVLARPARLAVAVLLASAASAALGLVCWVVTVLSGGAVGPTLSLSVGFVASGLMFTGVAAIAAQLGSEARMASSIAVGVLGVAYVVRGYVDASQAPDWATWVSPLGWVAKIQAGDDGLWPLLVALAVAGGLIAVGFALQARRDFGGGVIAAPAGPAHGGPLTRLWGLPLRLHRGSLIAWLIAFTALGLVVGDLASSMDDLIADNPIMSEILASGAVGVTDLASGFTSMILQMVGVIAAVLGTQIILRVHSEEINDRVEPLLAGPVRRGTYLATNASLAFAAAAIAVLVAGTSLGLVASTSGGTVSISTAVAQSLATVPAVWALVAVALAAVGAAPRFRFLAWLAIVATFGLTILGPTFDLPDWALGISPLHHVPNVTASAPDWTGLVGVTAVAVALVCVGFVGFRRRDII